MQGRTITVQVEATKTDEIASALMAGDFEMDAVKDAFWQARKKGTTATLYKTGKLVVQGAYASQLVSWLAKKRLIPLPRRTELTDRIGTDEAGKGDYFGPLVTAAVLVRQSNEGVLFSYGVRDSKKLSDRTVLQLATEVRTECPHAVISVGPRRYNELQAKLRSVNRVLGWAHARAIENILQKHSCQLAVADQFGDELFIKNALMEHGKEIDLLQMPRAEEDVAVAAASILARAGFLEWLESAARKFSLRFPKGASKEVVEAAKSFAARYGQERLKEVAKLHFRTTKEVLGSSALRFSTF